MGIDRQSVSYSFKASGESQTDFEERNKAVIPPPIVYGIKTPMLMGEDDGLLRMHKDFFAQVGDNLRNLLITNHGDRVGNYFFGANLEPLLFEMGSESGDKKALGAIGGAISKFMPFVSPSEMAVLPIDVPENDTTGVKRVAIMIKFTVPAISPNTRTVQVTMAFGG